MVRPFQCAGPKLVFSLASRRRTSYDLLATCSGSFESIGDAGNTGGPRNALSCKVYETIAVYFNNCLNQDGIVSADAQPEKLSRLLFAKLQVSFLSDQLQDINVAARILMARLASTDLRDVNMA